MFAQVFAVVLLVAGVNSQASLTYSLNHDGSGAVAAKMPVATLSNGILSTIGSKALSGATSKGLAMDFT
jgi:hypothetical protein